MKLVILDRDGTINEDREDFIKSADEWVPLPGALEAISRLNHAGWHTVIATNQSGLARGFFDMAALNAIHLAMNQALAQVGGRIDAVFFCPHNASQGCQCRKPLPGLFQLISERYGVQMKDVPVVGDSLRDLQAGAAVGCAPHLVRTGKAGRLSDAEIAEIVSQVPGTRVHADLAAFAAHLIQSERAARGSLAEATDSSFGGLT
ncbi:D-glycero-beta-D-manno-heptose 1,7-bisphosphate 7-phosphatase [Piscinibacter koreensis]|uniref:D-glycero-beta-D-manno-heptose-1,7-bisphosphate 7-phosphatase n=1 Tax=Piscinibacter koreensis TaxID=2742824 RepID=A0A7Y6NNU2_9BURK|nr:D-glycero-beta-D-manno-heptose 1,7-bisphosphate 7-phosphatase [Schlegelella koreensis]NUZ06502.1 D-glycero-beta-D-manno-heptose 1,7-bisphosphate 7-phosphatase [Schlegelella koreensis]